MNQTVEQFQLSQQSFVHGAGGVICTICIFQSGVADLPGWVCAIVPSQYISVPTENVPGPP